MKLLERENEIQMNLEEEGIYNTTVCI